MIAKARSTTSTSVIPDVVLEEEPKEQWSLKLSAFQLIVGWMGIGILMFLVFLFGLYAGRKQGVELALEEQSTPRLRLPVTDARHRLDAKLDESRGEGVVKEDRFDFGAVTQVEVLPEKNRLDSRGTLVQPASESPAAGFVGKTTGELLKDGIPKADQPKSGSLLESIAKIEISPDLQEPKPKKVEDKNESAKSAKTALEVPKTADVTSQPALTITASKEMKAVSKNTAQVADLGAEKKTVLPSVGGNLYVQAAAPESFEQAQGLISRLKAKGIMAAVRDAKVNGKLRYRVLVGPFSSKEAALAAKTQVTRSGVVKGEPFLKNY